MIGKNEMSSACRRAWTLLEGVEHVQVKRVGRSGMIIMADGASPETISSVLNECACTEPSIRDRSVWVPIFTCELTQQDLEFFETKIRRGMGSEVQP